MPSKIPLNVILGLVIAAIFIFIIFIFYSDVYGMLFQSAEKCKASKGDFELLVDSIRTLSSNNPKSEAFIEIANDCTIIAFNKNKLSLVTRPEICTLDNACLCLCYKDDCTKTDYCQNFMGLNDFVGDYSANQFKNQVYLKEIKYLYLTFNNAVVTITENKPAV